MKSHWLKRWIVRAIWAVVLIAGTVVIGGAVDARRRLPDLQAWHRVVPADATASDLETATFADYLLPLATDVPRIDMVHLETPSPLNPLGVKGAGEGGTIPAIAAIVAAVENALAPFGVTITEAPITPQRIVELLGDHALGRTR